ncbi:MAG: cytochrome c biogenesis protein CcsA, partial [Gammaproteobacteria bacterium]
IKRLKTSDPADGKNRVLIMASIASLLHLLVIYHTSFTAQTIDVGFFSILSLVGWLIGLLLILSTFKQPVECLGIVVFPFAALSLGLAEGLNQPVYLTRNLPAGLEFHILMSILAYSMLSIAVVQAILLSIQERHLHNKQPGGFIRALPPLETMETLLFSMIGLGFSVLTISLASGLFYLENILAQHLVHKTVLSFGAWFLFGILLWGRFQFGWRGRTAIRWTISGFILLMLAYFGSKFVIELVLNR